jgi:hypothetical protein
VLAVLVLGGAATAATALVANRSQQKPATQEMDHYIDRDLSQVPQTDDVLRISRETGAFTIGRPLILYRDRNLPAARQQLSFTLGVPVRSRSGAAAGLGGDGRAWPRLPEPNRGPAGRRRHPDGAS